jgi:uncharacterized BrkB/YihY/UPF0761 family membrane protein
MEFALLIPIIAILSIAYVIKALLDARTRGKLIAANGTDEMIRSLVQNEEQQRRHASVRWGVVLVCLAIGFALIQYFGWDEVTPGAIAVLLGATGVGNLVSFYVSRNLPN